MTEIMNCTTLMKGEADAIDFETNYKAKSKLVDGHSGFKGYDLDLTYSDYKDLIDGEQITWEDTRYSEDEISYELHLVTGHEIVMATSRPKGTTAAFVTAGDKLTTPQKIHDGKEMKWDFSNTDDDVTAPTGFKRKRFDLQFIDKVWIKEGSVYFHNTLKNSYISFGVVCPSGEYYKKNDGTLALATEDTLVHSYVTKHYIQGDCPMGDELNTEAATLDPLPNNYYMRVEVTVPDTDSESNGFAEIELYRVRTAILE